MRETQTRLTSRNELQRISNFRSRDRLWRPEPQLQTILAANTEIKKPAPASYILVQIKVNTSRTCANIPNAALLRAANFMNESLFIWRLPLSSILTLSNIETRHATFDQKFHLLSLHLPQRRSLSPSTYEEIICPCHPCDEFPHLEFVYRLQAQAPEWPSRHYRH